MPFLPPAFLERYKQFWAINQIQAGLHVEGEARKGIGLLEWPDFLGNGLGYPSFFVSERVILSLKRAGIEIGRLTAMPIGTVNPPALKWVPAPDYFVLEALYGIEMNYSASGVRLEEGVPKYNPVKPPNWVLDGSSWSGRHLLAWPNPSKSMTVSLICTERVMELAGREKWTNCRFEPLSAL
jgi:hypothetical protein